MSQEITITKKNELELFEALYFAASARCVLKPSKPEWDRPALRCINITELGEVVGVDGFRLHVTKINLQNAEILDSGLYHVIKLTKTKIIIKLISEEEKKSYLFPDYPQIIPLTRDATAVINADSHDELYVKIVIAMNESNDEKHVYCLNNDYFYDAIDYAEDFTAYVSKGNNPVLFIDDKRDRKAVIMSKHFNK